MKKFFISGILILVYLLRLISYPFTDHNIDQEFGLGKLGTNSGDRVSSDERILILEIKEEPSVKNNFITIKTKIDSICHGLESTYSISSKEELNCKKFDSKVFVKTRVYEKNILSVLEKSEIGFLQVGDKLIVKGSIKSVFKIGAQATVDKSAKSDSLSDGDHSISANDKGYENYLKKEKIFYEFNIKKLIEIEQPTDFVLTRKLVGIRKSIEKSIADSMPKPESDLAQGLVISGKGSMSEELLEDFKRVGLIHIVVLSGSNVSIISAALFAMLKNLSYPIKIGLGIFSMICFAIMTGGMPPVVRSVLMTSLPLIFGLINRQRIEGEGDNPDTKKSYTLYPEKDSPITLLLLTAMFMAIHNPLLPIYDISFQLSFMATLGLMVLTEPISKTLSFIPEKFSMREIVSSSIATQIYVSPLLLTIGNQISTVFLLANLLVLPILPIVMFLIGVVSFTRFIMPQVSGLVALVSTGILHTVISVVSAISGYEFATVSLRSITAKEALIAYLVIVPLTFQLKYMVKKHLD